MRFDISPEEIDRYTSLPDPKPPSAQVLFYRRHREQLIKELGGCCAVCGSTEKLEFDHKGGNRTWNLTSKSRWMRIIIYKREAKEGKLRLLCKPCNIKDKNLRKAGGTGL